jgi:NADPH:quinone reductase-like Zn-dependent oxidoreductase
MKSPRTLTASSVFPGQALESAKLKKGSRVLVHAGAGGVGSFAVQLAKVHYGAYVVATSGPKNTAFLKEEVCPPPTLPLSLLFSSILA